MPEHSSTIQSALFGVAVGDALGVPYEFKDREELEGNPASGMVGYGVHHQPAGTWSDDASLAFCLAEAMTRGFDLNTIARNVVTWYEEAYWTAHGHVFDVGNATDLAISRLKRGVSAELAGGTTEYDNGNGSLMRILPLLFHIKDKPMAERFELTRSVSAITHGHIRSVIACFYYLEFARHLLQGTDKHAAYSLLKTEIPHFLKDLSTDPSELARFDRLLNRDIQQLEEDEIESSGYVVHTLEASIWCLLTTGTYSEAVLKAVNLGEDTDTTAAVTGGLAGLLYGYEQIPAAWIEPLARKEEIDDLCQRLAAATI
jgi:ADP-ribosyl-[dinitrogen reductase] hydrolase